MNYHDAVSESEAVSSDTKKTARHPAGLLPTVSTVYKTYRHTHKIIASH